MKRLILSFWLMAAAIFSHAQKAPDFWNDIVSFKRLDSSHPQPANAILFVGSSSFTKWTDVQSYFPGKPIINRGFGGSILLDVIRYAYDIIIPYQPKQVVIYCGENDLAASDTVTAEQVATRFKTLFGIIRQNLPHTTISFVSIKPSPSRKHIFNKVVEANKKIAAVLKKEKNASYIDVFTPMLNAAGAAREELFLEDMLHMKPEGYRIWQRVMAPYLK